MSDEVTVEVREALKVSKVSKISKVSQRRSLAQAVTTLLTEYGNYRQNRGKRWGTGGRTWAKLVANPAFDFAMGVVIVANAVTIGVEASNSRAGGTTPVALQVFEYIFLFIYTVELALRFAALGYQALCNSWVQFDLFLVIFGFLDIIVNVLVDGSKVAILDHVLLVRTFRLARLARVLRLMIKFQTLWMLVQGLMNSIMTLVWTCIIICIFLFIFAVLGLELITPLGGEEYKAYNLVSEDNFGGLLEAMTSLLQGLTLDSFGAIYRPVILARPVMVFYFVPFLLLVSIALMNLVTALMVNFSLEQTSKDKQMQEAMVAEQRSEMIRILEQAFRELDANNSGQIDLREMLEAPEDLKSLILDVADMNGIQQGTSEEADLTQIFTTLDCDGSGFLEIREFCQGLLKLHDREALESYFIMKHCVGILNMLKGSSEMVNVPRGSAVHSEL